MYFIQYGIDNIHQQEKLVGSLQTFEMTFKKNTKKKCIALKAKEQSHSENESNEKSTKVAMNFKKKFRRDSKDYKRMLSRRSN